MAFNNGSCFLSIPLAPPPPHRLRVAAKTSSFSNSNSNSNSKSPRRDAVEEIKGSLDLLPALSTFEDVLEAQDCNIILRYFGGARKWAQLSQLFEWMQRHKKLNTASYSSYFKYLGLSHNPGKVLQVYDGIPDSSTKLNVSVSNSVLGSMMRNDRYESCFKLFDQMKREGVSPDVFTYNTLLAGCIKLKNGYTKAMELIQELSSCHLQMDSVIYGTLLAVCASHRLHEQAEVYFQKMKNEGHNPNLFHYSSLLNAYAADGNYKSAEILMNDMRSSRLTPNKVMLTTLLKVYSKAGLFEKSRELLVELEASGYAQEEMPYCILIDSLAKRGNIEEAKKVFAGMKEKGVRSDGYSFSIMISALCRCGLCQEGRELAKEFETNYATYDLVMVNTLLRAYCNAGDMESVMQILKKMDELTISPDWNTFHTLIKYFCKEKLYHLAYKTIEDMHLKGQQLNEELCSSVIVQLGKAGFPSEAFCVYCMLRYSKRMLCKSLHEKMLDILVAAGLLKDAYVVMKDNVKIISGRSLNKFASSFMDSGNLNLINDVLKGLHRSGHQISQDIFRKAIVRYMTKHDKKQLLLHLLEWMTGQGYCVDSASRNLLLKNAQLFGSKQLLAELLSKQLLSSRKPAIQKHKT